MDTCGNLRPTMTKGGRTTTWCGPDLSVELPESWSGEVQRIHLRPPTYCTVDMYLKSVRENVTLGCGVSASVGAAWGGGGGPPRMDQREYKGGRGSDRGANSRRTKQSGNPASRLLSVGGKGKKAQPMRLSKQ